MAEVATLARPYARAAFEAALAEGEEALPRFSHELALLTGCMEVPELRAELLSPRRVAAEKAAMIQTLLGEELSQAGRNFVSLLTEQGRLVLLPEIQRQYEQLRARHEKVLKVEVVCAREIGTSEMEKLTERLTRRFDSRVELTTRIDPDLIGGAVIRAGDTVIDGSVRGRLIRLSESLGIRADHSASSTTAA